MNLFFKRLLNQSNRIVGQVRLLKDEEGSQMIELALVAPVLLLVLVAAVDLGRAYFVNMEVSAAAEAGAIYGVEHPTDLPGMQAASKLNAPDLPGLTPTASYGSECSDGSSAVQSSSPAPSCSTETLQYVEVDTTAMYKPIINYPGIQSLLLLTGKSRMRITF